MAKISLYNKDGKQNGEVELNDAIFGVQTVASLLHQVYVSLMANLRQPWAHTKDRSEVAGGGRKPWKQKGTGRARHGSIRSPIWKGGGATFGPRNVRNYSKKINRKMRNKAVKMSLSAKAQDGSFMAVEEFATDGKTKTFAALRNQLPGAGRSTLILTADENDMIKRASRNIQKCDVQRAIDLNLVDLLHHQYVIASKKALDVIEKRFA